MRITQLPSGFWAVWYGKDWIDASSRTREQAQEYAYSLYVAAMDDELNRADILPMAEYSAAADWDGLEFDENGEAL